MPWEKVAQAGLTQAAREIFTQKTQPVDQDLLFNGYRYMWIDFSETITPINE
jgi:hypothetical protein